MLERRVTTSWLSCDVTCEGVCEETRESQGEGTECSVSISLFVSARVIVELKMYSPSRVFVATVCVAFLLHGVVSTTMYKRQTQTIVYIDRTRR